MRISHREFYARTNKVANALMHLGLRKGSRCAILAKNNNAYLECFYGVPKAGGVFVPLNYRLSPRELVHILNDCCPQILIYDERFGDKVDSIKDRVNVENFISLGGPQGSEGEYEQLLDQSSKEEPEISLSQLGSEDDCCIIYTSGTTGMPKGVVLTQRNMVANMWGVQVAYRCTHLDTHIAVMPFYHAGSLQYSAVHYAVGGTVVILERFDVEDFFRVVEREKVTTAFLVSSLLERLAEEWKKSDYDIRSLRLIFYGASGIPRERLKEILSTFECQFTQGYGMTELGPRGVSYFTPEDHEAAMKNPAKERRLSSCGTVTPTVEIKIVDDSGKILSAGEIGEICVRGEPVFRCYWNNEKETEQALRDGWFHTGDLGFLDEDGFLYIVDRKKDMIISGGENIYSAEVEKVILSHPCVLDCAVFGIPDKEWGEAVHAMIVLRPGMRTSEKEIVEFCKQHMASYKKPRSIQFVDFIPRNSMGKIVKQELRDQYLKNSEGSRTHNGSR